MPWLNIGSMILCRQPASDLPSLSLPRDLNLAADESPGAAVTVMDDWRNRRTVMRRNWGESLWEIESSHLIDGYGWIMMDMGVAIFMGLPPVLIHFRHFQ